MPPSRGSVVLAETDPTIATQLMDAGAQLGIETTWCRDGAEALLAVGAEAPDVLVIAAQTSTVDAASGEDDLAREALAAGASALVARPYDITAIAPFAITASIDCVDGPPVYIAGPIEVDPRGYETRVRGRDVQLTQRELELLVFLIKQRGQVASSEEISRAVWGRSSDTNTVAVHVKRLREKLGSDREHGEFIRTIRGAGYRLAPSICA
ncbi:MAG TPA: response regulator transcription factor [Mycobacterium sp.]|nr:response regulator transcription factor [Mycobacterium sp.]